MRLKILNSEKEGKLQVRLFLLSQDKHEMSSFLFMIIAENNFV